MKLRNIMYRSFIVNILLIAVKVVFGFIFGSLALIADGVHSVSDLMTDMFVILGLRQAQKPADDEHPFGHGKFEYVLSLFLGLFIIIMAYNLLKEVISNIHEAVQIPQMVSIVVVVFVVVVKLILATYLIKKGKETNSEIIQASGKESLSDVFSSIVVFIGIISVIIGNEFKIDFLLEGDTIASVIISLFIIRIGIMIIFEAVKSIQGKAVKEEISSVYHDQIEKVKGVLAVDQLDMIAYGPYYQVLVDIQVEGTISVKDGHDIAKAVSDKLSEDQKICHVIVHVNPGGVNHE